MSVVQRGSTQSGSVFNLDQEVIGLETVFYLFILLKGLMTSDVFMCGHQDESSLPERHVTFMSIATFQSNAKYAGICPHNTFPSYSTTF